jgi:hypothetical protein
MARTHRWWHARYELRVVRSDAPEITVLVRSRHRFRALAELSRRMDQPHMRLMRGCQYVVADLRKDAAQWDSVAHLRPATAPAAARRLAA